MRFCEFDQQQGASNWIRVREFGTGDWISSNLVEEQNDYLMRRCVSLKDAHFHFASLSFLPPFRLPHFPPGLCIFIPEGFLLRSPIVFRAEERFFAAERSQVIIIFIQVIPWAAKQCSLRGLAPMRLINTLVCGLLPKEDKGLT